MKRDLDLQLAVIDELGWEPGVKASEMIGVSVADGVVTLTGFVDSYPEKLAAERGARRLSGVIAVADEIEVRLPGARDVSDADLTKAVETVLDWNVSVPNNRIKLTVADGWITLEGTVDWQFQRLAAEKALRHLTGVIGISNKLILAPKTSPAEVKSKIEAALERRARIDAQGIKVALHGNKVILSGTVRSCAERDEAVQAAWAAPGVCEVEDCIRTAS